jgi:hypothetical protein
MLNLLPLWTQKPDFWPELAGFPKAANRNNQAYQSTFQSVNQRQQVIDVVIRLLSPPRFKLLRPVIASMFVLDKRAMRSRPLLLNQVLPSAPLPAAKPTFEACVLRGMESARDGKVQDKYPRPVYDACSAEQQPLRLRHAGKGVIASREKNGDEGWIFPFLFFSIEQCVVWTIAGGSAEPWARRTL